MKYNSATPAIATSLLLALAGCVDPEPFETDTDDGPRGESIVERQGRRIPPMLSSRDPGGGYGSSGATTTRSLDTTASHLSENARAYLIEAGVSDASSIGATEWVKACRVRAYQGAGTFNSGESNSCTYANVRNGWIIVEVAYDVLENKHGRGSASVSATNGPVTISRSDFGSKFDGAMSLAASSGDSPAETELQLEYQRLNGYSYHFGGAGNQLVATVTANGGAFRKSAIEIQAKARLLRVH